MSAKETFLEALNILPDGLGDKLDKAIPDAPVISTPTDVDTAIVAQGILAKYLLDFFHEFAGFTPAEAMMRIGQKNIVNQGILLAELEYIGSQGDITVITPVTGGVYYGYLSTWKVELIRGSVDSITGHIGEDEFEFEEVEEKLWSATWPVAIGTHNASITATFQDGSTATEEMAFEIKPYSEVPTVPEEGSTADESPVNIQFLTGESTDDIEDTVEVSIDLGDLVTMNKVSLLGFTVEQTIGLDGEEHSLTFYVGGSEHKTVLFYMGDGS